MRTDDISLPVSVSAILFDVDGTLYSQACVRRSMFVRLASSIVLHPLQGLRTARLLQAYRSSQEELRGTATCQGGSTQLACACAKTGIQEAEAKEIILKWMEILPLDLIARAKRPGLMDFLKTATERGIRCGVVSDYPAEQKVKAMGIRQFFSVVISPETEGVSRFKPSPQGLQTALRVLGAKASSTVYVGDRLDIDREAAHRAGIAGVIIAGRRPRASRAPTVRNFVELRSLLLT